jgi:hypothetical protein
LPKNKLPAEALRIAETLKSAEAAERKSQRLQFFSAFSAIQPPLTSPSVPLSPPPPASDKTPSTQTAPGHSARRGWRCGITEALKRAEATDEVFFSDFRFSQWVQ